MNLFWQFFESTWGNILIVSDYQGLITVTLPGTKPEEALNRLSKNRETILTYKNTPLLQQAKVQLEEYFHGDRQGFRIKLNPQGTSFQKKVWHCLQTIPFGETRSYQDIAKMMGHPKAMRAVGMANNKNPLPIIIPCHRVIGKNGDLVGFGGGIRLKKKLLDLESRQVCQERVTSHQRIRPLYAP